MGLSHLASYLWSIRPVSHRWLMSVLSHLLTESFLGLMAKDPWWDHPIWPAAWDQYAQWPTVGWWQLCHTCWQKALWWQGPCPGNERCHLVLTIYALHCTWTKKSLMNVRKSTLGKLVNGTTKKKKQYFLKIINKTGPFNVAGLKNYTPRSRQRKICFLI